MRSRRLATLERLAAMAERSARLRLAGANQDVQRKVRQQELLEGYDAEYSQRWLDAGRAGVAGQPLRALGAFRESLARMLDTQDAAVRGARAGLAKEAGNWQRQRERLRVYGQLVEQARRREALAAERRAQRVLDDLAGGKRRVDP